MVNSRLSRFTATLSPPVALQPQEATRVPLLPKVRGQVAEFLDRGALVHLGRSLPAYQCRYAVRAAWRLASGFSRRPGVRGLPPACASSCQRSRLTRPGFASVCRFQSGNRSCPFDRLPLPIASPLCSVTTPAGAGLSNLLAIAYDYDVLGLGPDSPWDD